eukprot:1145033-Pelagomonas_calceolata.AAC.11
MLISCFRRCAHFGSCSAAETTCGSSGMHNSYVTSSKCSHTLVSPVMHSTPTLLQGWHGSEHRGVGAVPCSTASTCSLHWPLNASCTSLCVYPNQPLRKLLTSP